MNVCGACIHFHLYDPAPRWADVAGVDGRCDVLKEGGHCKAPYPISTFLLYRNNVYEDTKADTCPMFAPTKLVPRF